MDVLELLKSDHERVADLFDQFESTDNGTERWRFFQIIRRELTAHAHAEETVFYPAFRRYDELKDLVEECFKEHQEVKDLLAMIEQNGREHAEFEENVTELRENVDHHVEEEENEFFPHVRKIMKRNEREVLGRHIQAEKQQTKTAA